MARDSNDIKAPDGFLLGGLRRVRKDGTILFQRRWWQAPLEWAGEKVWIVENSFYGAPEVAPPGQRPYSCAYHSSRWYAAPEWERNRLVERTQRADAKPSYRRAEHKRRAQRAAGDEPQPGERYGERPEL